MPLAKRIDKFWKFVGTEVANKNDLTPDHIRAAYGLTSSSHSGTEQETPGQRNQQPLLPYCGNKYERLLEAAAISKPDSTNAKCSAAKCKDNPNCLNYLGQDLWESEGAFDYYRATRSLDTKDPKLLKRDAGHPAGLRNLGATCYASSLLQCWFQDYAFRNTIFQCQFPEDEEQLENKPLYQLQLLFGFMDRGIQSVYNPESLVKALNLDTAIQQDAQEFYSLFLNLLDRQFAAQDDETIQNFVKTHFCGHYSYKTECNKCGTKKSQRCAFYDITVNIKNNSTLTDCLDEFVEPEELTGSDQYLCSVCDSLQDATRSIQFEELPDVLNISLMRYRYDKETWLKKKSFDIVRFPEVLDFSEYLKAVPGQARKEELYDLTAVLVHSGTSAYSGHYMANVWNPELSRWTLLNDEQVVVFDKDSAFNPDAYTGFDGHPNGSKKPKTTPKASRTDAEKKLQTLSTKNAYLLTYTRRKPSANIAKALPLPVRVMEEVQKQNDTYEEELAKDEQKVKEMRAQFEAERSALRGIYQHWHVSSDQEPCYYVAASSLEQYIKYPENVPLPTETAIGMANNTISCAHGKLCPLSVTKAKRINKEAGLKLINDRMDIMAPILTDEDLCESCVSRIVQEMLYSTQHRKDTEEFERKNKSTKSAPTVWISKAWINEWLKKSPKFRNEEGGTVQDDTSPSSDEYLSDVFCPHGNLPTDKAKRKLVNKSALEVLTRIFGQLDLPSEDSEECALCIIDQSAEMAIRQQLIDAASDEKKTLAGLAMRGQRVPNRDVGDKFYAINKGFLQKWLNFIKRPSVSERPNTIDNSQLLCEHDGLLYDVLSDEEVQNSDAIALLRDEEWAFLSAIYGGGPEIFFLEPPSAEDGESTREIQVASHRVCAECRNTRQLDYESGKITIRMMTKADYEAHNTPKSEESPSVPISAADDGKDSSKKRSEPVVTYSRRSKRVKTKNTQAGKSNNIKVFMLDINKHDTVMDLKLKIMQKTNVVPLYQRLIWNKVDLDNNEATMGSLGILPQSSLDLIIFEESSDQLDFMQLEDSVPTEPTCPMELGWRRTPPLGEA